MMVADALRCSFGHVSPHAAVIAATKLLPDNHPLLRRQMEKMDAGAVAAFQKQAVGMLGMLDEL